MYKTETEIKNDFNDVKKYSDLLFKSIDSLITQHKNLKPLVSDKVSSQLADSINKLIRSNNDLSEAYNKLISTLIK